MHQVIKPQITVVVRQQRVNPLEGQKAIREGQKVKKEVRQAGRAVVRADRVAGEQN